MKFIFLIPNNYADVLTPYLNSIEILSKQNKQIIVISYTEKEKFPKFERKGQISFIKFNDIKCNLISKILLKLNFSTAFLESLLFLINRVFFIIKFYFYKIDLDDFFITTDPFSLIAVFLKSKIYKGINYIYFEQEINFSKNIKSKIYKFVKKLEIKANQDAKFSVEFDEVRANILSMDNKIDKNKIIIIPNSSIGSAQSEREYYFHEIFNLNENQKILLFTGGIASYNYNVELIKYSYKLPENVVTVMHLFGNKEKVDKLISLNEKLVNKYSINKVFFSTKLLPFDKRNLLYQSSDFGFCMYDNENINLENVGFSSGRLFNFLIAGKPVILRKNKFFDSFLNKFQCGVCLANISEIIEKFNELIEKEEFFQQNALKAHEYFRFDKMFFNFLNEFEKYAN